MTQRTDVHSPTNMDPADYQYLLAFDNADERPTETVKQLVAELETTDRLRRGTWQCHHCGARIRYVALLRHIPTGEVIAIGETCLDNRFSLQSKRQFDALRKASAALRAEQRIVTAVREWLPSQDAELAAAMQKDCDLAAFAGGTLSPYAQRVLSDMRRSLWKYGELTVKQVAFASKLIAEAPARHIQQERIAAERAAEVTVKPPSGRTSFEGVVIKTVDEEGDYGWYTKLTIKVTTTAGVYLVRVTEPSSLRGTQRGDVVRMDANLTPSTKAGFEHFAFGKRPSKAQLIERPSEAPEIDALAD